VKASSNDKQSQVRHETEKEDADFVDRHAGVMDGVELLSRQMKPSPMQSMHPIMGGNEYQGPKKQNAVIYDGTP
jgi:hypothetical protein